MAVAVHRPSRWVIVLAICSLFVTAMTIVGPSLTQRAVSLYRGYQDQKADESFREFDHFYDLTRVARNAARSASPAGLQRGRFAAEELARTYRRFPSWDWNYGNAIHYLHLVKGRIALSEGDLEGARCHLLEAGMTPGSPQLGDYGPDMTLAQEMLENGESATVLQYFAECDRFWGRREKNRLAEWSVAVRAGQVPDFGTNSGLTPREILR